MQHPSHFPPDQSDLDLNNIFIGREQQIDLFEIYFQRWKNSLTQHTANNDIRMQATPSPHNKIQGLLILLYGRGGFGKSTLLRRYRTIVLEENKQAHGGKVLPSDIIDWETIPESRRSLFALSQGKGIDTSSYFTMLCTHLAKNLTTSNSTNEPPMVSRMPSNRLTN